MDLVYSDCYWMTGWAVCNVGVLKYRPMATYIDYEHLKRLSLSKYRKSKRKHNFSGADTGFRKGGGPGNC